MAEITIEQVNALKEEISKRDARLKKAVQVFNDQKATISRLTDENTSKDTRIAELEAKLAEYSNDDVKFFEQEAEIAELNDKLTTARTDNEHLTIDVLDREKVIDDLNGRLNAKINDFDGLVKKYEERKKQNADLQTEYDTFKKETKEKMTKAKEKYAELKVESEAKSKALEAARANLNEFFEKMKICVSSIGAQATAINNEIDGNKIFE